jgi:hypothetical protein
METGIIWKDVFTIGMILFAVIDIVGSIPIIVDLRSKMGHIQSEKATLVAALIMIAFLFVGDEILKLIGIDANFSITKLFDMLNTVENSREKNSGISSAFSSLFKDVYGIGSDPILEKKKSIISGFPIPNTKGDILEFLSLAIPNAKQKGNFLTKNDLHNKSHNDLVSTWYSKCEQIVMKAKFSMKEDKKTLEEIINYAKEIGIK